MTVIDAPVAGFRTKVISPRCRACQPSGTAMAKPARRGEAKARSVSQWYPAGSATAGVIGPLAATRLISCSRAACESASATTRMASTTAAPPPPNNRARRCRPGRRDWPLGPSEAPDTEEVLDADVAPDVAGIRAVTSTAGDGWADAGPVDGWPGTSETGAICVG